MSNASDSATWGPAEGASAAAGLQSQLFHAAMRGEVPAGRVTGNAQPSESFSNLVVAAFVTRALGVALIVIFLASYLAS